MNKKYEITNVSVMLNEKTLYRIRALVDFGNVQAGDLGGYIEKEENLSHYDNAWVYGDAKVYDNAEVYGNAKVYDNAEVYGNAKVYDNALVYGNAKVYDNAWVYGNALLYGNALVCCNAKVYDNAWVYSAARVYDNAEICGKAKVCCDAWVCCNAKVYGNDDYTTVKGFGTNFRTTTFFRCKDNLVRVSCGCFYGTIEEFRERVKTTRTGKLAKEYLMIADLMEYHFDEHSKDEDTIEEDEYYE